MKTFKQWAEEKHPESFHELNIMNMGRKAAHAIGHGINRARVGMKRAGELIDRTTGEDPHSRQRANRQNHKDREEFRSAIRDL